MPELRSGLMSEIESILDYARWAPSGDNIQPWRFEILDDNRLIVYLTSSSDDLYDYRQGEPTLLSGGMLLESMRIAASRWGRTLEWQYEGRQDSAHRITVSLPRTSGIVTDPLVSYLPLRSVDRCLFRLRPLTEGQKAILSEALGPDLQIAWHESLGQRWQTARIGAKATVIRLTTPETFLIHKRVLDWVHAFSPAGIPAGATGIVRPSLWLMRWAMESWPRMRHLNRFGAAFASAVQMDYMPGLFSAAFFTIRPSRPIPLGSDQAMSLLNAGGAIQRFWLTASSLGVALQPNLAPICFASYGRCKTSAFTTDERLQAKAERLAVVADQRVQGTSQALIFWGRIGTSLSRQVRMRSIRQPLHDLLIRRPPPTGTTTS